MEEYSPHEMQESQLRISVMQERLSADHPRIVDVAGYTVDQGQYWVEQIASGKENVTRAEVIARNPSVFMDRLNETQFRKLSEPTQAQFARAGAAIRQVIGAEQNVDSSYENDFENAQKGSSILQRVLSGNHSAYVGKTVNPSDRYFVAWALSEMTHAFDSGIRKAEKLGLPVATETKYFAGNVKGSIDSDQLK